MADWKQKAARKVLGKAAREGMEEVAKDVARDAVLDAVLPEKVVRIADTLDDVADGTRTARRINKVRKLID